ncbi:glycoside hydrolase family 99-like domain-containing protein [Synechococcus sp. PCC 6312]|uniref:glycoside hydrolase family 99-like domain-containing protein n=1 Tax=Synechococcus sp. (strain ATCC 27167 / PCC 6312) TaxID=195253 RepID=UPI00029F44A2|nr:glycoside hydrolase family 99-like domain-containing protein [Synechococcus sp. PCC 6312]AFY62543.1 hypothetical protein Syn6312_3519 [Synechococcus sp. PCC 6312]
MTKIIALYFPQLHAIPENDEWWGEGFTDWVNVRRATPLFPGHYQPRIPANNNYYDQSKKETIKQQVSLAKQYGIYGFCHYHYWFNGKQLLEKPTNIILENKDIDIKFCLAWANETWSRRWDGQDHDILQLQTHPPEINSWSLHFDYLIKAWTDKRAITIDGKPIFLIYRPQKIHKIGEMFNYWKLRAKEFGLNDIFFIAMNQYQLPDFSILQHFNGVMLFQPFYTAYNFRKNSMPHILTKVKNKIINVYNYLPSYIKNNLSDLKNKNKSSLTFYDYDVVWRQIICEKINTQLPLFEGAFVDWDNTARYRERATIFRDASPYKFEMYMKQLIAKISRKKISEQFIFINAWNEWAESAYLEPDSRFGLQYLDALRSAISEYEQIPE